MSIFASSLTSLKVLVKCVGTADDHEKSVETYSTFLLCVISFRVIFISKIFLVEDWSWAGIKSNIEPSSSFFYGALNRFLSNSMRQRTSINSLYVISELLFGSRYRVRINTISLNFFNVAVFWDDHKYQLKIIPW